MPEPQTDTPPESAPSVEASPDASPRVRSGAMGLAVSLTKNIFYLFGITQPTYEQEVSATLEFWGLILLLMALCGAGVAVMLRTIPSVG